MRTKLARLFLYVSLIIGTCNQTYAQVTIGSGVEPNEDALLDLKQTETKSTKGLLLPRVELTSALLPDPMSKHVAGMIIYNTRTINDVTAGYYYNNGNKWIKVSNGTWFISSKGSEETSTDSSDDIYHRGSVTIGKTVGEFDVVDPSAILDINASNKGVLLPRVALTSATDTVTITNPTIGLLIFNTGTDSNFKTTGYLYWDGSQWKIFASSSAESAKAELSCAAVSLSPNQQIVGNTAIISGSILQIPYTGSNGGNFNGATLVSTGNPNVTAVITSGFLAQGNGVLSFAISGIPTIAQQAPNGVQFDLKPFYDANPGITGCKNIVVGDVISALIEEKATMGRFILMTDNTGNDSGTQYYGIKIDSPDGKFSVRASVPGTLTSVAYGNQNLNIQLRNNQNEAIPIIWNFNTDYGGSLSNSGVLTVPAQVWGGDQNSGNRWYNATGTTTNQGVYWGQVGIYDAANQGPEYRRYTWIPIGEDGGSVSYEVTIMVALDTKTPGTAVHPTMVKGYIKITQVTATN